MSIWGKVIGGVAGFALGGPLGAILGVAAGHAVDKVKASEAGAGPSTFTGYGPDARQVAFTTAIIVLAAKMAKADGRVTPDEIATFKRIFQIPPGEQKSVAEIWRAATRDAAGYEPYAQQIATLFHGEPEVREELLGALFHIAKADGVLHPNELQMLTRIAGIFGFDAAQFERIRAIHLGGDAAADDPYEILGLSPEADDETVKRTYRKLSRENHPDALVAKGVPQEFIELANEKMAAINAAYDRVAKSRGLK
ncbi:MAG: TerB family tellurite resistance protein [Rhodospirillaceae bacterium]